LSRASTRFLQQHAGDFGSGMPPFGFPIRVVFFSGGRLRLPQNDLKLSVGRSERIRRRLLAWYDRHRRDLPWRRRSTDAYAQWVAEVMLQQTRVETVLTYYAPFLRRFPTLGALARAPLEDVLKPWEGLGYYRRAINLHRAAGQLRQDGRPIPSTAAELRKLPGIGTYTAAAVASIAFGERVAAVDGNVARVLARLFGVTEDATSALGRARLTNLATQLLPLRRCGDFNQAWMDLGSMICTPRSPRCGECPLSRECVALRAGQAGSLPLRRQRRPVPVVLTVVGIVVCGERVLVRRRAPRGLWAGLWEFPGQDGLPGANERETARGLVRNLGLRRRSALVRVGELTHRLTHRLLDFRVYRMPVASAHDPASPGVWRWVTAAELQRLPVCTAHRRLWALARATEVDATRAHLSGSGRTMRARGPRAAP